MIRYRLGLPEGQVIVSIAANNGNHSGLIQYEGEAEAIEVLKEELPLLCGAFGHLIGDTTTPIDLDAVMHKPDMQRFTPELLEGAELVERYDPGIPEGAIT